jgi:DNA-directed RNA polymerase subunit RPC12/RpoP
MTPEQSETAGGSAARTAEEKRAASGKEKFRFLCNSCGQKLEAREASAGQPVKCPRCGTDITVPEPAAQPVNRRQKQEGVRYTKPPSFKFFCLRCGQSLEVVRDLVGTQLECHHCKNTIAVPSPPDE